MEYRPLGRTGIKVSAIGLGTMTFGEQNSEAEGHEQLDYAIAHGVNLIDTAEMRSGPAFLNTERGLDKWIPAWFKLPSREAAVQAI